MKRNAEHHIVVTYSPSVSTVSASLLRFYVVKVCQQLIHVPATVCRLVTARVCASTHYIGSATIISGTCWPRSGSIDVDRHNFWFSNKDLKPADHKTASDITPQSKKPVNPR
jgi:hypothetical protein